MVMYIIDIMYIIIIAIMASMAVLPRSGVRLSRSA
jgi:hypothetical protein